MTTSTIIQIRENPMARSIVLELVGATETVTLRHFRHMSEGYTLEDDAGSARYGD